ncbi:MAG: transketolase [Bdellovibrionaceae bacterium]|nr:transketolase [Pseudobdellovibrionaceae bacterium]
MRERLSNVFVEQAKKDPNYIMLSGDHGYALFDPIRKECPDQFLNVGVAEQSMVGYAAGLCKIGMKPVIYGLSAFVPMRVLEQIKLDLCHSSHNVTIIGDGAGLVYAKLGSSHQCCEDLSVVRALPNMTVYSPCDIYELESCFLKALSEDNPTYIRLGKADRPTVHNQNIENFGIQNIHNSESTVAILATGSMVSVAKKVAKELNVSAFSVPQIVPMDCHLSKKLRTFSLLIICEEHSTTGGLYSAILEELALTDSLLGKRIKSIGIQKKFNKYCGSWEYAMSEHQLTDENIFDRIKLLIED